MAVINYGGNHHRLKRMLAYAMLAVFFLVGVPSVVCNAVEAGCRLFHWPNPIADLADYYRPGFAMALVLMTTQLAPSKSFLNRHAFRS